MKKTLTVLALGLLMLPSFAYAQNSEPVTQASLQSQLDSLRTQLILALIEQLEELKAELLEIKSEQKIISKKVNEEAPVAKQKASTTPAMHEIKVSPGVYTDEDTDEPLGVSIEVYHKDGDEVSAEIEGGVLDTSHPRAGKECDRNGFCDTVFYFKMPMAKGVYSYGATVNGTRKNSNLELITYGDEEGWETMLWGRLDWKTADL